MLKLVFGLTILLSTSCYHIHFHNGQDGKSTWIEQEHWHHGGGIFGLIEFSPPRDPIADCGGGPWQVVRTRDNFLTGLVSSLVPYGIYTPKEYGVTCVKKDATVKDGE